MAPTGIMIPICPRCDTRFIVTEFTGIEVDYCFTCGGIWFDAQELELLLERTGAAACIPELNFLCMETQPIEAPKAKQPLCPRCDEPLELICPPGKTQELTLDRCPHGHGIWFDAGELQTLLSMFDPTSGAGRTIEFLADTFAHIAGDGKLDEKV